MKNYLVCLLFLCMVVIGTACRSNIEIENHIMNPNLTGFYPDPNICKVGEDFYLVTSTFAYFPGLPVFHSKDLMNWDKIGHIMTNPGTFDTDGLEVSEGLFAPAIRYNDDIFYVVCTFVHGNGNFVVTATNPAGPWSDPIYMPEINDIDPSLFFDDDGTTYIVYNSIAPDDKPLYEGHRTIRMYRFDKENKKVLGEEKILINGGVDITQKPGWIEAPHLIKKDGLYYLIAAEGSTGYDHSEVDFRCDNVWGPYEPGPNNPILTQRHLNPNRLHPITSTGHADFVQLDNGGWGAVFLGCRPYEGDHYNTGRETFILPVIWENGWPVMNPDFDEVQYSYPAPFKSLVNESSFNRKVFIRDEFTENEFDLSLVLLRTPKERWFEINSSKLALQVRPETVSEKVNPSFLGRRQQHLHGYAATSLDLVPLNEKEKAGIVVFQNRNNFYFLCKSVQNNFQVVQLYKSSLQMDDKMDLLTSKVIESEGPIYLKIESNGATYSFYYANKENDWRELMNKVDAKFLSTHTAGGFGGCMYGLYATSLGETVVNTAYYNWFECKGEDIFYKSKNHNLAQMH
jgi:xylan 1,4-beta-xylosidase